MSIDTVSIIGVLVVFFISILFLAELRFLSKRAQRKKEAEILTDKALMLRRYMRLFPQQYPDLDLSQKKVLEETINEALDYIEDLNSDLDDVKLAIANIEKRLKDFCFDEKKYNLLYYFFYNILKERDWGLAQEFADRHPGIMENGEEKT